jgi:hypothetical protein
MIEFLNTKSAFEHYKRVLGLNSPVETRATYQGDRVQVSHYNAPTGQFIIGAIFTKGTRRDPGSFLCLLSDPVKRVMPAKLCSAYAAQLSRTSGG